LVLNQQLAAFSDLCSFHFVRVLLAERIRDLHYSIRAEDFYVY